MHIFIENGWNDEYWNYGQYWYIYPTEMSSYSAHATDRSGVLIANFMHLLRFIIDESIYKTEAVALNNTQVMDEKNAV